MDESPITRSAPGAELDDADLLIGGRTYQAVLIDLDGTLLTTQGRVPQRTAEVIHAVQALGVRVMIVTGRSIASACAAIENLRLETPICAYNGGAFYCTRRQHVLHEVFLEPSLCRTVLELVRDRQIDCFVNQGDRKVTLRPLRDEYALLLETLIGVEQVDAVADLPLDRVARLTLYGHEEEMRDVLDHLSQEHAGRIYLEGFPISSLPSHRDHHGHVCDVHPPTAGKAEALHYLESELGIPREDVVAVGDGRNDVPMVRGAGLGVAMEGAFPELKAVASRVIGGHDEEAVAALLSEIFLEI